MKANDRDLSQIRIINQKLGISDDYAQKRNLIAYSEAKNLIKLDNDIDERSLYLKPDAAEAWNKMKSAAEDTIVLQVYSGFRNYEYQKALIQKRLDQGEMIDQVLEYLAAPGYSEHHTGLALDLTTINSTPGSEDFENTAAFAWLQSNAKNFSFYMSYPRDNPWGFVYEPWHWAYKG